jgi:chaperonin GroEL (HSP60 family)
VILTAQGIDDLCLKEFVEAGAMAVRRCKKEDLRRIAKATGATMVSSLANLEGEESFEAVSLGSAEEVEQVRISDDELILIKGTKIVNSSSIILRGANDYMLDEMERALHDSLSIIKRTLESGTVLPGGGAVEVALSIYLENFATTLVRASHYYPHCRGTSYPFSFPLPAFPDAGMGFFSAWACLCACILTCNIFFFPFLGIAMAYRVRGNSLR